jgi:hypothetical protein
MIAGLDEICLKACFHYAQRDRFLTMQAKAALILFFVFLQTTRPVHRRHCFWIRQHAYWRYLLIFRIVFLLLTSLPNIVQA